MKTSLFDFELPNERIALRPVTPRENAKLLVVGNELIDKQIKDLSEILRAGDCLVFNTTKVIPAELTGVRVRGENRAKITLNLHKKLSPSSWVAFGRPAKKMQIGDKLLFAQDFYAEVLARDEAEVTLHFNLKDEALDQALKTYGIMPLPPYIAAQRKQDEQDKSDYQTIFALQEGSVAAPTAGLHFTPALLAALEAKGVEFAYVTLHVGAGTFLPVKVEETDAHKMHAEWGEVSAETQAQLANVRAKGGRVIAVGTTSLRLLESAKGKAFADDTAIFITPGYQFTQIDGLMTNFHLPKSTLFMLVSALSGREKMLAAYKYAISHDYRFYSYGDACLLLP